MSALIVVNKAGTDLGTIDYEKNTKIVDEITINGKNTPTELIAGMINSIVIVSEEINARLKLIIFFNSENKDSIKEMNNEFENPELLGIIQIIKGGKVNFYNIAKKELITIKEGLITSWDKPLEKWYGNMNDLNEVMKETTEYLDGKPYTNIKNIQDYYKDFINYLEEKMLKLNNNNELVKATNYFLLKNMDCFFSTYKSRYITEIKNGVKKGRWIYEGNKREIQETSIIGELSAKLGKENIKKLNKTYDLSILYLTGFRKAINDYINKLNLKPASYEKKIASLFELLSTIKMFGRESISDKANTICAVFETQGDIPFTKEDKCIIF